MKRYYSLVCLDQNLKTYFLHRQSNSFSEARVAACQSLFDYSVVYHDQKIRAAVVSLDSGTLNFADQYDLDNLYLDQTVLQIIERVYP